MSRGAKYQRARIRNFLFTSGPNRLSGGRIARRHLEKGILRRELAIASPAWPREFDGLRIAHVSDFHLGKLITLEHALDAVRLVRTAAPDLVACTGDVVDLAHDGMEELLASLAQIGAPMGTLVVAGNHDELECGATFRRAVRNSGCVMLDDDVAVIQGHGDGVLTVAGIGWARSVDECSRRLERACPDGCDVLLAHNPKAFTGAARLGVSLVLSGHTHGGQVALPGKPNVNLALSHRRSAGVFQNGPSQLHVTTGAGSWFPFRMNCPAEVVVITMRAV